MKEEYRALFTPWNIGNVEIKNRIVLAPMGGTCIFGWTEPNHFDKEAAWLLETIAKNNCGLVMPGIAPVKDIMGGAWLYQHKWKFDQLKQFMEEFHKTGAKMFIQMTAGFGRAMALTQMMTMIGKNNVINKLASPIMDPQYLSAAPSATPNRWTDKMQARAITKKEIEDIIYAFGETARLIKEAGVDGVEVHAVHEGYLLDQFTLPYCNFRTDEYGGSFENRYRFAVEIVKEIKKKCGEDFPVSLRYSVVSKTKGYRSGAMPGEDYIEVGRTMEESERAIRYLSDAGYDMFNCDNGTYDAWYWAHPPQYMPNNCCLADVSHIKQFTDKPCVCAGKMQPAVGAKAIAEGKIDAMAVGRQFLADPEWVTKLIDGREDDIRPCICCHSGCFDLTKHEGSDNDQDLSHSMNMCNCAVNPRSMQHNKYKVVPTRHPKNVAVIGGGLAGMEAARILKLRGHNPTIYEKSDELGGVFIAAAAPDFKEHDKELLAWLKKQVNDLSIPVCFGMEVRDLSTLNADAVVVATGSVENRLTLPGAERAITAIEYLRGEKPVGQNVVIIGGGQTGCEIALDLHKKGKNPQIVEMKNDLMAVKNLCLANTSFLRDYFRCYDVPVYLESGVKEIGDDYVIVEKKNKERVRLPADSIIMSVGYHSTPLVEPGYNFGIGPVNVAVPGACKPVIRKVDSLVNELLGPLVPVNTETTVAGRKVYTIGDANRVANVKAAIWNAWDVAMKI